MGPESAAIVAGALQASATVLAIGGVVAAGVAAVVIESGD